MITIDDFCAVDIRVARIIEVLPFPEARKPSYRVTLDCGAEIGIKKSCAQLVANYTPADLQGRLVLCVVNMPARQIGPAISQALICGVPDKNGNCVQTIDEMGELHQ